MTLAKLARRLKSRRRSALPALVLVTDRRRLADALAAARALPAGSAVVLRDYDAADRTPLARRLALLCRRRRLTLLVAGDWRLAAAVHADGLHLAEWLVPRRGLWRRRPGWLVTAAAHGERALWRARRAGADAALLAPVFATASHPGARTLGAVRFAALARRAPLPVYALGGIDAGRARRLIGSGAAGIAALGALAPAPQPACTLQRRSRA